MIQRIKEVLLTQYIGAIVIGFLTVGAIGEVISLIVNPLAFYLNMRTRRSSIFAPAPSSLPWGNYLPDLIAMLLRVIVIWLLFRWLYMRTGSSFVPENEPEPEAGKDATA